MGNEMDFDTLEDALDQSGEAYPRDPHDLNESASPDEPHYHEPVVFLSPRPDTYTPVICGAHRLVQGLLTPTQRVAAESWASEHNLAIAR